MRAAFGQYTTGDKQTRRDLSRTWFMEAAVETEPQLAPTLFEIYLDFREGARFDIGTNSMQRFICCRLDQLIELRHPLAEVRRSVEGWARRFNLTKSGNAPEWILQCAFCSFSRWQRGLRAVELAMPSVSEILPDIDYSIVPPAFALKEWNPFFGGTRDEAEEVLKQYLKCVRSTVLERLKEIEDAAQRAGCYKASNKLEQQHYVWTARYQICGKKLEDIEPRADVSSVGRAITTVLNLVGIARRLKRGRPRGKPADQDRK